ncbi:MAG: hydrolase [Bacteriovoracaceae bacterium]|nr:hydrolase [Bacteriovoracaceae bacterium]
MGRRQAADDSPGLWEFPGGKVEEGEAPEDALRREFREEIECEIVSAKLFKQFEWTYPKRTVELYFFLITLASEDASKMKLNAHDELKWFSLEEALKVPILAANKSVIERLVAQPQP